MTTPLSPSLLIFFSFSAHVQQLPFLETSPLSKWIVGPSRTGYTTLQVGITDWNSTHSRAASILMKQALFWYSRSDVFDDGKQIPPRRKKKRSKCIYRGSNPQYTHLPFSVAPSDNRDAAAASVSYTTTFAMRTHYCIPRWNWLMIPTLEN